MKKAYPHYELTSKILDGFYHVYGVLGFGFLEAVYEKALAVYLRESGLQVCEQVSIPVYFEGTLVGDYVADLLVDGSVIVEVKACRSLAPDHEAQLLNYLKATPIEIGLLLNFGPQPEVKRRIFSNDRKKLPLELLRRFQHRTRS
ncbi:MAG: GxxExxY protein [Acidobacteriota bacterium]